MIDDPVGRRYAVAEVRLAGLPDLDRPDSQWHRAMIYAWLAAARHQPAEVQDRLARLPRRPSLDFSRAQIAEYGGDQAGADADALYAALTSKASPTVEPLAMTAMIEAYGALLERTGRLPQALALYRRFTATSPYTALLEPLITRAGSLAPPRGAPTVTEGIAGVLTEMGRVDPDLETGKWIAGDDPRTLDGFPYAFHLAGVAWNRFALQVDQWFAPAALELGTLLEDEGRFADANTVYAGVRADSVFAWLARLRIGVNRAAAGDAGPAIAELVRMAAERPEDGWTLASVGRAYDRSGDPGQAVAWLERAAALWPQDEMIADYRGDALWHAGRRTEARAEWQRIRTIQATRWRWCVVSRKLTDGPP